MSSFEVWLDDPRGMHLAHLDKVIGLELVHVVNDYGAIVLEVPSDYDPYIVLDGMIEVWFRGHVESIGFIRKITRYDSSTGMEVTKLVAYDGNYLLTSRIVAYAAGSAQASMTDQADDMLKAIVTDNLLGDATGVRNISGLSLSAAADDSDGQSITKGFSWSPLLGTCQDIAVSSEEAGTAVYFEFVPEFISSSVVGFEFRTWINQRGNDHGSTSDDPVYFGKAWGNLIGPMYEEDYTIEVNYVYAGGQGEGSDRNVNEVSDAARYGASAWNRREAFTDARNESSDAGVTAKGYDRLNEGRPVKSFRGEITDSPSARYGTHWWFGDRVICEYRGMEYDVLVTAVSVTLDSNGNESVTGKFEVVD